MSVRSSSSAPGTALAIIKHPSGELAARTGGGPSDRWLGQFRSPRTREEYRRDLGQWSAWLAEVGVHPHEALPGDLNAWCAHLRAGTRRESTLARKTAAVCSYYRWARREGLTAADPSPEKRPKVHEDASRRLGLSMPQVGALLAAAEPGREEALVALLLYTGVRVSEAVGADVADLQVEQEHRVLHVFGKGGKPRTTPVAPAAYRAVAGYLDGRTDGPLFLGRTGERMNRQQAWACVRKAGHRTGVAVHPHLLRHTAAVLMIRAGYSLEQVRDALGHADVRTTSAYLRGLLSLDESPVYGLARLVAEWQAEQHSETQ